jgi:phosphopantothenoylcysteine decarboxylase/phosphopantothenate--cysteine ligase
MGYALAQAARDLGAEVVLISGPTALPDVQGVTTLRVRSAVQMFEAVQAHFSGTNIMIAAAAVADYRVEQVAPHKLKKQGNGGITLSLVQNPDIVAWAAAQPNRGKVIAFAAETENMIENAQAKLTRKGVDAVLANSVAHGAGFEKDENHLLLIDADGVVDLGLVAKSVLAVRVWQRLAV